MFQCEECEAIARSTAPRWHGAYAPADLAEACAALGVRRPVRLQCATKFRVGLRGQTYPNGSEHVIQIRDGLPLDFANKTLLHELAHCAQADRGESDAAMRSEYGLYSLFAGYADNPFEVEAREVADRYAGRFAPLRVRD